MANVTIKLGSVSLTIPSHLAPPAEAGSLSPEQVARIPRAPRAVGVLCELAAQGIERAGKDFQPPPGVTPDALREAAEKADGIDSVIDDLEAVLNRFKQANLLFDAAADKLARQVNDQVKVQGKHNPELLKIFATLVERITTARTSRPRPDSQNPDNKPPKDPEPK